MSALWQQVAQAATDSPNGVGLPEVGGGAGLLAAALVLLDKLLNYRAGARRDAVAVTTAEQGHIADWASKLLSADMEARREDGADRRAITAALAGIERQMALQTEMLRQIQSHSEATEKALSLRRPMALPLPLHEPRDGS